MSVKIVSFYQHFWRFLIMITVGIIGCGFVGGALKAWLEENNKDVKIVVSDPPKGMNDDISGADVYFLQIHVPTNDEGKQDLTLMKELISKPPNKPVFVRTTILPGTSELLTKETGHQVRFMPEFLTERTYIEDFKRQPMVFTGEEELLKKIFPGKYYVTMTPFEAEITKYAHNVFGALKVTYFNCIEDYCRRFGADYLKVQRGCLLSGYINDTHTFVPGPDGNRGYGGKCFPKDVNALAEHTKGTPLGTLIAPLHDLNVGFRGFEEHI